MGDLPPVIDLSTLNKSLVVPHFQMETAQTVRVAILRQVESIDNLKGRISSCSHESIHPKISPISCQQQDVSIYMSPVYGNVGSNHCGPTRLRTLVVNLTYTVVQTLLHSTKRDYLVNSRYLSSRCVGVVQRVPAHLPR